MPIRLLRLEKDKYRVYNALTGRVHSVGTSLEKALTQKQLIDKIDEPEKEKPRSSLLRKKK